MLGGLASTLKPAGRSHSRCCWVLAVLLWSSGARPPLRAVLALPWVHAAHQEMAPLAYGEYQYRGAPALERADIPFFTCRTGRESPKEQRWQRWTSRVQKRTRRQRRAGGAPPVWQRRFTLLRLIPRRRLTHLPLGMKDLPCVSMRRSKSRPSFLEMALCSIVTSQALRRMWGRAAPGQLAQLWAAPYMGQAVHSHGVPPGAPPRSHGPQLSSEPSGPKTLKRTAVGEASAAADQEALNESTEAFFTLLLLSL